MKTTTADPLTEILHDLRLSGSFYCRSELSAPWGLGFPARECASFHFVAAGTCWLWADGDPIRLKAGDLVLLPHGRGHWLGDVPHCATVRIDTLQHEQIGQNAAMLRYGGDGERAVLVCGGVRFEDPPGHPLLDLMPDVIHIQGKDRHSDEWLEAALGAMGAEARSPRPGGATVITRLADVLVVHAVRTWLVDAPEAQTGWLGALRDPQMAAPSRSFIAARSIHGRSHHSRRKCTCRVRHSPSGSWRSWAYRP